MLKKSKKSCRRRKTQDEREIKRVQSVFWTLLVLQLLVAFLMRRAS